MTLGHRQTEPVEWLVGQNLLDLSPPVAAGLGRTKDLEKLLGQASPEQKAEALAMAVINGEREAARLCLEAGADPNLFMPCHAHSTPLHQAAIDGNVELARMLVAAGARLDVEDRLWRGIPLGWAIHGGRKDTEAWLRSAMEAGGLGR